MSIKNISSKFIGALTIVALFVFLFGPQFASASSLTGVSDTMTREQTSASSVHVIKFTATSGIAAGNTIIIVFPSGFTTTGLVITDLQICHGTTGVEDGTAVVTGGTACTSTDETIAASNGASTIWGATVAISGTTTITLTQASGTVTHAITAGKIVTVTITATHMVNPSGASTPNVTITTTSDSGSFTVPIIASDQITVSASVNESVTFSINASNNNTGSATTVPLSTLSTAGATYSNGGGVNSIWLNIGTNTSGGAVVTVQSLNGDLKSSSTSDNIPSATATMANGTANYGLCVKSHTAGTGTLNALSPFASSCGYSSTNSVGSVTTSPQSIINTNSTSISTGVAEVVVNAENSATTPAHSDYGDTLTFIATGTF